MTESAVPHAEAQAEQDTANHKENALRIEALAKAVELAPYHDKLSNVARAVNAAFDLDWTQSAWRGLWVRNPEVAERIRKKLGTAERVAPRVINIEGDCRGIVFSDIHAPFHDKNAIALACKVAKWWCPDVAIWNGDNADFYHLSRYDQNPARTFRIQDEIDAWHVECLAPLKAALRKWCRLIFLPGNHEARLWARLWQNPDLFGVRALDLPELFELKHYGMEYAERSVRFGTALEVTHGDRVSKWSGATARAEQEKRRYAISTITGHVHRAGRFQTRVGNGFSVGQEAPCLCSLDPEYMVEPDWVQGITLFTVKDNVARIQVVQFDPDYSCEIGKERFSL